MNSCTTCQNGITCSSCSGSLFLNNNQCSSSCSMGQFTDLALNICSNCSSICFACSLSPTNCTSCTSNLVYYSFSCIPSCPSNYFNISGFCLTCGNCNNCIDSTHCAVCYSGYYLYAGACYSSCPSIASIPDLTTLTCSKCGGTCSTCNTDGSYCFNCNSGYLSLSGKCYVTCPSGYSSDYASGTCKAIKTLNIIYYPFSILLSLVFLIVGYSKWKFPQTDLIGNVTALLGLAFFFSVTVLTFNAYSSDS